MTKKTYPDAILVLEKRVYVTDVEARPCAYTQGVTSELMCEEEHLLMC